MPEAARRARAVALLAAIAAVAAAAPAVELRPRREPLGDGERLAPSAVEPGQRIALRDGTPLGEIELAAPWRDFRGQTIAPGRYGLRYALQPRLKDHVGADAIRDFALLVPPGGEPPPSDAGAAAWIAASRRASGTAHPAVLALVPAAGAEEPVPRREEGGLAVEYAEAGGVVLGFVVVGGTEARDAF